MKRLFPEDRWNKLHLQIIFYGREHCSARSCFGLVVKFVEHVFPEEKSCEDEKALNIGLFTFKNGFGIRQIYFFAFVDFRLREMFLCGNRPNFL